MAQSVLNLSPETLVSPSAKLLVRVGIDLDTSLDLFVGTFGSKAPEQIALRLTQCLTDAELGQLIAELRSLKVLG